MNNLLRKNLINLFYLTKGGDETYHLLKSIHTYIENERIRLRCNKKQKGKGVCK